MTGLHVTTSDLGVMTETCKKMCVHVLCILDYVSDVMAKFVFVLHIFKDMMKVHFLSPLTEKKTLIVQSRLTTSLRMYVYLKKQGHQNKISFLDMTWKYKDPT